ncbi:MBL fold metallo-hydrolase [Oceaniglobus indicus]|uniref:MBL fold metallo-hydrolase n=1 Tax=Oceaniglobus indicus TaxID=2047749 RepID=UPI000C195549|nr:MBL fold metallo-hydrolase [Oceaniglobus indicus]
MQIEFVNHASVLITEGDTGLLSDPWYFGPAFHKGWSLLVETPPERIEAVLARTTHIWMSHEHPDHFSVPFFKTYGNVLRERDIPVLFQKIDDRRVVNFMTAEGIRVEELEFRKSHRVSGDMSVICLKDEFYDSALSVRAGNTHILNLNDCAVGTEERAKEIRSAVGTCDVLLTQFSYAAWKGGPENVAWRQEAARQKIGNVEVQTEVLRPRVTIPFASFVRFSNARNTYLNDAANTPRTVVEHFEDHDTEIVVMQPGDVFDGTPDPVKTGAALTFWDRVYVAVPDQPVQHFDTKSPAELNAAFATYIARVHARNNATMMRVFQRVSPVKVFQPVIIHLDDLDRTYRVDVARGAFDETDAVPDLSMHSESLWFLFSNSFGFDTLTVNGCLEEKAPGGFAKAAKSISIENLNNLGIAFGPGLVFHGKIIAIFLERLVAVSKRLRRAE